MSFQNFSLHYKDSKSYLEVSHLFKPENPFFDRGEAKIFKADGVLFTGFIHPDYFYQHEPYACFGYWDIEEASNVEAIFKEFDSWVKSHGIKRIMGPINFSTLHDYRVPLKDYKQTFLGEPESSSFKLEALKSSGFELAEKYYSFYIKDPSGIFEWGQNRSKRVIRESKSLNRLDLKDIDFEAEKSKIQSLINDIFKKNICYLPISDYEFNAAYSKDKISSLVKAPFFFLENQKKEMMGLFVSFFQENLFEEGLKSENILYFKTIGAVESKDFSEAEIFFYLIHEIYQTYVGLGVKPSICFSLMREGNVPHKVAKKFATEYREYGLFKKDL